MVKAEAIIKSEALVRRLNKATNVLWEPKITKVEEYNFMVVHGEFEVKEIGSVYMCHHTYNTIVKSSISDKPEEAYYKTMDKVIKSCPINLV